MTSNRGRFLRIVTMLFLGSSSLFAQGYVASVSTTSPGHSATSSTDDSSRDRPVATERNPRYRINRDDILSLTFPLSPEFNQPKVTVQPDGFVSLEGAGSLYVQGLTLPETVAAVRKAYSKNLHEPIVDIDLIDFQRAYFVVFGQVGKPGQYDLRYDMTVTEAIATAGGLSATAKTQVFLYHRGEGGWVEAKELKLKDILHGKNVAEDVSMRPGDMIFVPEKTITKFRKYVPYGIGTGINTGLY